MISLAQNRKTLRALLPLLSLAIVLIATFYAQPRAMSYFDLAEEHGGRLADAFAGTSARFCVVSFDTDWLYPTEQSRRLVHALSASGAAVSFMELSAPYGHDSFLLDVPALDRVVAGFLNQ